MNRIEFMKELEELLYDISPEERQEAIDYYNGYFDEAGEERESQVIHELGSPGKVAAIIKDDLKRSAKEERYTVDDSLEYEEEEKQHTWTDDDFKKKESDQTGNFDFRKERGYQDRKPRSTGFIVAVILLAIMCSPIIIGFFGAAFGILVGIAGTILGLGCVGIGLIIAGVAVTIVSIISIFTNQGLSLIGIAAGLLLIVIGMLGILLFVLFVAKVVPVMIRAFVNWIQGLLRRKGGVGHEEIH